MNKSSKEPKEWKYYDLSSMPILFKYDTWTTSTALSLLSGIDPEKSERLPDGKYFKIQLLSHRPNSAMRTWYQDLDEYMAACAEWQRFREEEQPPTELDRPLQELDEEHQEADKFLSTLRKMFESNPDHDTSFAEAPSYYIDWSKKKGIDIPWLEWAKARGHLPQERNARKNSSIEMDKRERDTLLVIIASLCNAMKIDPQGKAVAKRIEGMTSDMGCHISYQTILAKLKDIPEAIESKSN